MVVKAIYGGVIAEAISLLRRLERRLIALGDTPGAGR